MNLESRPSGQEAEKIRAAYAKADPTAFSELPMKDRPNYVGIIDEVRGNKIFEYKGEEYVLLHKALSNTAQFVAAKLLKGILSVSDVIKDQEGNYYSKVMPLEQIPAETEHQEIEADLYAMNALTGDGDHAFSEISDGQGSTITRIRNMRYENRKIAYFDFDCARDMTDLKWQTDETIRMTEESLDLAEEKLNKLQDRLAGPQGLQFLQSVIQAAGETPSKIFPKISRRLRVIPDETEALQRELLERIDAGKVQIAERRRKNKAAA